MALIRTSCYLFLALLATVGQAQIKVTRTEKLPLVRTHLWEHPQFSPTGATIYFTDHSSDGIWEYTLQARTARKITSDPKSGLSFSVSPDGRSLIYRRTRQDISGRTRKQDVVLVNLAKLSSSVLASGSDVSVPAFTSSNAPVYSIHSKTIGLPKVTASSDVSVLGIENQKIVLSVNGNKSVLDPLGNGSYIWPALSPDKQRLVAYEMDRGTFVCDLAGKVLNTLGRRDAPSWTRSGKWIVYMEDKDDGHKLLSSDLFAVSPDGKTKVQLTSSPSLFEMFPQCSPTENKVVCSVADGSIIVMEYEERQ